MASKKRWKRSTLKDGVQYDFVVQSGETEGDLVSVAQEQAEQLDAALAGDPKAEPWTSLALEMPQALREVLHDELRRGNLLTGIGRGGWPSSKSIVGNLLKPVAMASVSAHPPAVYRSPNDPHYAREEITQLVEGVEFMLLV